MYAHKKKLITVDNEQLISIHSPDKPVVTWNIVGRIELLSSSDDARISFPRRIQ